MKIIFYGAIDKNYSSNQIFLQGFSENGVSLVDAVRQVPISRLSSVTDAGIRAALRRVWSKIAILNTIQKRWAQMHGADAIFVGYPGHFDVPFAYILSRLLGAKLVFYPVIILTVTFSDDIGLFSQHSVKLQLLKLYERWIYSLCDILIADGAPQKNLYTELFGIPANKVYSVPLGANNSIYAPGHTTRAKNVFTVVYYGRYSPIHGVEYIIQSAALLTQSRDIRFMMIGNGQLYPQTKELAQKLQVHNVDFYPDIEEDRAMPFLEQADVFLGLLADTPTSKRQIPNKVYQGLALGKAVVTADVPIMRSTFDHDTNIYLIPAANPKALAQAIIYLKTHPEVVKNIGKNGLRTFHDHFTPQKVTEKILTCVQRSYRPISNR